MIRVWLLILGVIAAVGWWILSGTPADPETREARAGDRATRDRLVADPPATVVDAETGEYELPASAPDAWWESHASLTGRVIDSRRNPQSGVGVRLFTVRFNLVMPELADLLAEHPPDALRFESGSARTGDRGQFRIDRVVARGLHLLVIGGGGPNAALRLVDRTLRPGSVTDMGEVRLPERIQLQGHVVDATGKAVAGARVLAVPTALSDELAVLSLRAGQALVLAGSTPLVIEPPAWLTGLCNTPPVPTAITASDGSFALMAPQSGSLLHVEVGRNGLHRGALRSIEGEEGCELRLPPPIQLRGRVSDGEGRPVVGAEVRGGALEDAASLVLLHQRVNTDRDGDFVLEGMHQGPSVIAVRRGAEPYAVFQVDPDDPGSLALDLGPAANLEVQGIDAAGKRLDLTDVSILPGWTEDWIYLSRLAPKAAWSARRGFAVEAASSVESDTDGVNGDLSAGTYGILARSSDAAGFASAEIASSRTQRVLVEMQPVRDLDVRVLDKETGLPVAGALVTVVGWSSMRSDWRGRAVLEDVCVTGTRAWFGVNHPAFALNALNLADVELEEEAPHLTVRLEKGAELRIDVADKGKVSRRSLMVAITPLESLAGAVGLLTLPRIGVPDGQGSVHFTGLEPGPYEVAVAPHTLKGDLLECIASGGMEIFHVEALTATSVTLQPGWQASRRLDLGKGWEEPACWLRGLLRIDGQAQGSVQIHSSQRRSTTTEADGFFDFGEVPPEIVRVTVMRKSQILSVAVALEPAKDQFLDLDLWTVRVEVLVRDEHGALLPRATVYMETSGGGARIIDSSTTGEDGRAELHSFVSNALSLSGDLELTVSAPGYQSRDQVVQTGSANHVRSEVRLFKAD